MLTFARLPDAPDCRHHVAPILPPPVVIARQMMEEYLKDPSTPEAVRKAPRRRVLELLTNREKDRYDAIAPKDSLAWTFPAGGCCSGLAVRVCFSSASSMSRSARGTLTFGGLSAVVSNNMQVDSLPSEPPQKPKNTGVGSLSLLQRIFLTQELNRGLLHCRRILYQLSYQGCKESDTTEAT